VDRLGEPSQHDMQRIRARPGLLARDHEAMAIG
jgi:hypothetical protein